MQLDQALISFLNSQDIIQLATNANSLWITNLLSAYSEKHNCFVFVSDKSSKHGLHLEENSKIAVATAWHHPEDVSDRKGIQATGTCIKASDRADWPEIQNELIEIYINKFPSAKGWLTAEMLASHEDKHIYTVNLEYIKFWSDSDFGAGQPKEYS